MAEADELEQAHDLGQIKAEVHTLNTLVKTLFKKFDDYVEKSQPKPLGPAGYIGIAVSILTVFALLFGSVIYIANSANAPLVAQMAQMTQAMQIIQSNSMQNTSQGQLISKELSGIEKSVGSNEETLRWIIFTENLPKQITETQGRINTLEMKMNMMIENHTIRKKHGST